MDCNRRRVLEATGLAAVGTTTALAGCSDERPGVDDSGDPGAEDEEDPTGGHPDEDHDEEDEEEDAEAAEDAENAENEEGEEDE